MRPPPDQVHKKSKQKATGSRGDSGSGLDKPRARPLNPPKGDIATSGEDYGTKQAEKFKGTQKYRRAVTSTYTAQSPERKRELVNAPKNKALPLNARKAVEQNYIQDTHRRRIARNEEIEQSQAKHDVMTAEDMATLQAHEKKAEEGDKGGLLAAIYAHPVESAATALSKIVPVAAAGAFPAITATAGAIQKITGAPVLSTAGEVAGNAGRELVDIPANTPASVYALGKTTKEQGPVAGAKMLAQPYVDLYHDPAGFAKEHPLSTGLMLAPTVKMPLRAIGKAETRAVLGTTGVEDISFGKGIKGSKTKTRPMTEREVHARVDVNVHESWNRKVNPYYNFMEEFSHKGAPGKPKTYKDFKKADEDRVAVSKKNKRAMVPVKAGVEEDSPWVLVDEGAMKRLQDHSKVFDGTPKEFTQFAKLFRQGVLLSSPKWIPGNVTEAALRGLVSRSGLVDYASAKTAQNALNRYNRDAGNIWDARTASGGHSHLIGQDQTQIGKSLTMVDVDPKRVTRAAQAGHNMAEMLKGAKDFATGHPLKGTARSYNGFSKFVFESVNGNIEHQFQTAQMGQVLRKNKIIPRVLAVRNRQLANEWAKGTAADPSKLRNLATAVGKEIDRSYGKYGKLGPKERWYIGTFTPFYRWTANALNFLYHVMPADHPVLTAATASLNVATEKWRKEAGQYYSKEQLLKSQEAGTPTYLQGGIPGKGGSVLRVSHYTPAGIHEQGVLGGIAGLLVPFWGTLVENAKGNDWKGDKLANDGQAIEALAILTSLFEQSVPGASLGLDALGIRRPNMSKSQKIPDTTKERVKKRLPFTYTHVGKPKSSSGGISLSGGGDTGGFDFGGGSSGGFDFSQ